MVLFLSSNGPQPDGRGRWVDDQLNYPQGSDKGYKTYTKTGYNNTVGGEALEEILKDKESFTCSSACEAEGRA